MRNQSRALDAPAARCDPDSGYTLHGRWFDDPYAWLERQAQVPKRCIGERTYVVEEVTT
jgi:hypothetical protein